MGLGKQEIFFAGNRMHRKDKWKRVELLSTKVGKVAATAGVVGKVSSVEMCELECELE